MRTRKHDWYDANNGVVLHGIEVFVEGIWKNYAEDNCAWLAANSWERDAKRKELRKIRVK
jgi:hypothetical protein